jgi:hypothetical protein
VLGQEVVVQQENLGEPAVGEARGHRQEAKAIAMNLESLRGRARVPSWRTPAKEAGNVEAVSDVITRRFVPPAVPPGPRASSE